MILQFKQDIRPSAPFGELFVLLLHVQQLTEVSEWYWKQNTTKPHISAIVTYQMT